jgi:hypothetical protein
VAPAFPETSRRYSRCLKKLGYPSAEAAEQVRVRRQAQVTEVLRVYACQDCGLWHLTHRPMTDAQVRAEMVFMEAEITALWATENTLKRKIKPYTAYHAMYGKTAAQITADFREQFAMQQRIQDLWMAVFQRQLALSRAMAVNAAEVRQIEREARQQFKLQQRVFLEDRTRGMDWHRRYLEALRKHFNTQYRLPYYPWRAGQVCGSTREARKGESGERAGV